MYILNPQNLTLSNAKSHSINGSVLSMVFQDDSVSDLTIGGVEKKYVEYTSPEQLLVPDIKKDIDSFITSIL